MNHVVRSYSPRFPHMIATWFEHLRKRSHFFISINYLSKTPPLPMLLFFLFLSKSFLSFVISWRTKIISVNRIQLAVLGNRKQITKRSKVHRYVGTRGTISVVMFKIPPLNIQHATEEIFNYSVPTVKNNYMDNHIFLLLLSRCHAYGLAYIRVKKYPATLPCTQPMFGSHDTTLVVCLG